MRKILLTIVMALWPGLLLSQQLVQFAWDVPSPLVAPVAKYTIKWGRAAGGPYNSGLFETGGTTASVRMDPGKWFFVITASYTNNLGESGPSNEVSLSVSGGSFFIVTRDGTITVVGPSHPKPRRRKL